MIDRKPIKLLVVTMLYEPDCVGIAAIASDMCAGLAERGNDVTVYTTYPYYPEWTLKRDVNSWRVQQESIANVDVRRFGLFVPSNPSRLLIVRSSVDSAKGFTNPHSGPRNSGNPVGIGLPL